jgi:hypothetical protein
MNTVDVKPCLNVTGCIIDNLVVHYLLSESNK